ncbi:MAG: nucleoside 2-deoxyribosyltransferase [Nanoarchaeota archaeon]|nr:nucleoside 2-deoxyribosyltransferase [Nanoarchaeota archaeon]
MKVYIAGKLSDDSEKEFLEKIANLCEKLGFKTFLPHRDVGIAKDIKDAKRIFNEDIIKGFRDIDLIIADLNGLHIGAGTSWELGYAYAKNIPAIGIKTDESIEEAFDYLSSILISSMEFVDSLEKLEQKLKRFKLKRKI